MSVVSFQSSIAQSYDAELGPLIFTSFAKDFASKIPVGDLPSSCRVLELAAGTGRLTVEVKRVLPTSIMTVTDLSEEMLAVAKTSVENNDSMTFTAANMQELPFPDASFDLVVAQFGFMLCADYGKAFAEARRVLAPGGRLMFNVWGTEEFAPMFMITMRSVSTYVTNPEVLAKLGPMGQAAHRLSDKTMVTDQLTTAGFTSSVETPVTIVVTDIPALAKGLVIGTPFHTVVPAEQRDDCIQQTATALGTSCSMLAHLYEARV